MATGVFRRRPDYLRHTRRRMPITWTAPVAVVGGVLKRRPTYFEQNPSAYLAPPYDYNRILRQRRMPITWTAPAPAVGGATLKRRQTFYERHPEAFGKPPYDYLRALRQQRLPITWAMPSVGYGIHTDTIKSTFDHTSQVHSFYGPADTLWAIVETLGAGDWVLWKYSGIKPTNHGDYGSWSIAQENAAGDLPALATRSTDIPTLYYADGVLHVYTSHGSPHYSKLTYNAGTDDWTVNVDQEAVSPNPGSNSGLTVDSNGVVWIAYFDGSDSQAIKTIYRDSSWNQGGTIQATGDGSSSKQRMSPGIQWNDGGTASVGWAFTNDRATDEADFAYRADSAGLTDALTVEVIDNTITADNHASIAVGDFSGDSSSTIIVAFKFGGYSTYRRAPDGTWGAQNTDLNESQTRIKLALDSTNKEVYAIAKKGKPLQYWKSVADTALSWGSGTDVLDIQGFSVDRDVGAPQAVALTADAGLLVLGTPDSGVGPADTWWNIVDFVAAVITPVVLDTEGGGRKRRAGRRYPRWVLIDGVKIRVHSAEEERQLLMALQERAMEAYRKIEEEARFVDDEPAVEKARKRVLRVVKRLEETQSREDEWDEYLKSLDEEIILLLH